MSHSPLNIYHRGRAVESIFRIKMDPVTKQSTLFDRLMFRLGFVRAIRGSGGSLLHVARFLIMADTGPIYRYYHRRATEQKS